MRCVTGREQERIVSGEGEGGEGVRRKGGKSGCSGEMGASAEREDGVSGLRKVYWAAVTQHLSFSHEKKIFVSSLLFR